MSGLPFSGKSYVVDLFVNNISLDVIIISPKDFIDKSLHNELSEDEQTEVSIAAWEASLDLLWSLIESKDNNQIIIYDTACTSYKRMFPYFDKAKTCGHMILFAFINANLSICEQRAGNKWLPGEVVKAYVTKITNNLPKFIKISDKYIVINNNSGVPDVSNIESWIKNNTYNT